MTENIQNLIASMGDEKLAEDLPGVPSLGELEHYGVLGMKWGVRKDRNTGKKIGKPVKGTKRAKHTTPSVSPKTGNVRSNPKQKPNAVTTQKSRKTRTTASGETVLPSASDKRKRTSAITTKLDQRQKSKLGSQGLSLEDLNTRQLREISNRMKLEKEISEMLDGPDTHAAMQVVVNRIKIEQEYKRLTAKPPTFRQKVRKETVNILGNVARRQAENALNRVVDKNLQALFSDNGLLRRK